MLRLCTICARGGSKGVKNKNVRELIGKPLIAHSILQARESGIFKAIAVSSDSDLILETAGSWGADYLIKRPVELASDTAPKVPVIQHCTLETEKKASCRFDIIVDLDATSPLRDVSDIQNSVKMVEEQGASNLITAAPARRSPYFNLVELNEQGYVRLSKLLDKPIGRRQDSPQCYDMNASIYVWRRDALMQNNTVFLEDTLLYVMPEARSVDIDSELDFEIVQLLMKKKVEG